MPKITELFQAAEFSLYEFACAQPKRGGRVVVKTDPEVVFVRRGMFAVDAGGRSDVVSQCQVLIVPSGSEFTVDHPIDGGDDTLVLRIAPAAFDEHFGPRSRLMTLIATSSAFLLQHRIRRAIAEGAGTLKIEELLIDLLRSIGPEAQRPRRPATVAERRTVIFVQELLAARYAETLTLPYLAGSCGISASHLSRTFRRVTGVTLHRYQHALRLRAALGRIAEGEGSLTELALALGYADHSHFTSVFRREFGFPPSVARLPAA